MIKSEFIAKINELCEYVKHTQVEDLKNELIARGAKDVFSYSGWCEKNFEKNLREDYKRKTTFAFDFSIAEWCVSVEGMNAISDTLKNVLTEYKDNVPYFAEILLVLNLKSWEHNARGNNKYMKMYAQLYYDVRDLYFDWFDAEHVKHDEAMQHYFDYID